MSSGPFFLRTNPYPQPRNTHLAHSDGYWHLFDVRGALVAVADDQASTVRVSVAPEKGVWIATKFFREPSKEKDYP